MYLLQSHKIYVHLSKNSKFSTKIILLCLRYNIMFSVVGEIYCTLVMKYPMIVTTLMNDEPLPDPYFMFPIE